MAYSVDILCDSVNSDNQRLTTMVVTFPRFILAQFNTHRVFSRNSASSRAIPTSKLIQEVSTFPFVPMHWPRNQPGMQSRTELDPAASLKAHDEWLLAKARAVDVATSLMNLGVHKQVVNRLLEPFMWHTALVTATEWDNFFALRCDDDAQPEIATIATKMKNARAASTPTLMKRGEWHLPFVTHEERSEFDEATLKLISVGRCARVSYKTHDGKRDPTADISLAKKLQESGHMSPFEHQATPIDCYDPLSDSNFVGWLQYRKTLPGEKVFEKKVKE